MQCLSFTELHFLDTLTDYFYSLAPLWLHDSCLHLTLAADAGGSDGHGQDEVCFVTYCIIMISDSNMSSPFEFNVCCTYTHTPLCFCNRH